MADNLTDFKEIVRKIESMSILLPDFQREFVWRDEEQQKQITASVLARMPIGSVLLLKSKPDEYSSKKIGNKTHVDATQLDKEVEFLLDGQQRITVLANVFSSIIHEQCEKVTDLISPTLKKRFFLRVPKWSRCRDEVDLFGVHELQFKYQNPDSEEPNFLSADIYPFIECIPFLVGDGKPYNPQEQLTTELDTFCLGYEKGYLVPLYLLAPCEKKNKNQYILRYKAITNGISERIGNEIESYFTDLTDDSEKDRFIDEIFDEEPVRKAIKADHTKFHVAIFERADVWNEYLRQYLDACVKSLALNRIVVKEEQRARAIDIYENLNRGGVSLNTFDLIMARVAKVSTVNFYQRMIGYISDKKKYNKSVLPDVMAGLIGSKIDAQDYNASTNMGSYNQAKNEIASKYIDAFLDVLSLHCYNPDGNSDDYKIENIKRNQILKLSPEQIDNNTEKVCIAIDRALFFFQTRCGIRSIQELNYSLMLVLVASIFIDDKYFNNPKVHNVLEAWYWGALFGGEYDKDQGVTMISHLQAINNTLQGKRSNDWLISLKDNVFNAQNFSDEKFLLMEKVDEDRYPKVVFRLFICQYLLSKTYTDMFDTKTRISVFAENANDLEAHHIIPLGSVSKINESTSALRKDAKNICNSPLNFVFITSSANKAISNDSLDVYAKKITNEAKYALHINAYNKADDTDTDNKVKTILRNRYNSLSGDVKQHISDLLL